MADFSLKQDKNNDSNEQIVSVNRIRGCMSEKQEGGKMNICQKKICKNSKLFGE